jgi:MFS family permease
MATRRSTAITDRVPSVLRHRDFALLWSGQSISLIGDGIFTVALAIEALQVDARPTALSFVLAARLAPMLCLVLVGGVIVDRVPRRLAMLASDGVRGLAVAVLAVGVTTGDVRLWGLVVLAAVFGVADAFFAPASTAILPELLPAEFLLRGNALNVTSQQLARVLIGPALGGLVVATFGAASAFALDAASFAVSAGCLLAMTHRPKPPSSGRSMLADARAGLRYVRSQRWLFGTILVAGVMNLAGFSALAVLVPLLLRQVLHDGPAALGLVVAAGGAGGVLGSLVAGRLGQPKRRITATLAVWGAAGLGLAGLGLAPNALVAAAVHAVIWVLISYGGVLWHSLMQQQVPADLLGRASSVDWLVSFAGSPVGLVLVGVGAGAIGVRPTVLICGVVCALMALVLFVPGMEPEDRP